VRNSEQLTDKKMNGRTRKRNIITVYGTLN